MTSFHDVRFDASAAAVMARRALTVGGGRPLDFVKDEGVYLLAPDAADGRDAAVTGEPAFADGTPRVLYADGLGSPPEGSPGFPFAADDPWMVHRNRVEAAAGGDDFGEPVDPREVLDLTAGPHARWLVVRTEIETFDMPEEMAAQARLMFPGSDGKVRRLVGFEVTASG